MAQITGITVGAKVDASAPNAWGAWNTFGDIIQWTRQTADGTARAAKATCAQGQVPEWNSRR